MTATTTMEETKESQYIDFTNTSAYRTVKAWHKIAGIFEEAGDTTGRVPSDEFTQLKRLRKLDSILKPDKGPILKEITVKNTVYEYYYELPTKKEQRKKYIDNIIENSEGTYPENVLYYYKELGPNNTPFGGKRDGSFSYEEFENCSIEEMKELSNKG